MSSYFETASPNIIDNEFLREPQIEAYEKLKEHFIERDNKEHALVVLPTGTGKTGLMGIAPYNIAIGITYWCFCGKGAPFLLKIYIKGYHALFELHPNC